MLGCGWVLTTKYSGREDSPVSWQMTTIDGERVEALNVEGTIKENPYLVVEISATAESEESSRTVSTYYGSESENDGTAEVEPATVEQ